MKSFAGAGVNSRCYEMTWRSNRRWKMGQTDGLNEAVAPLERSLEPDQSQIELRSFNVAGSQSNLSALRHLTVGRLQSRRRIQWTRNSHNLVGFVTAHINGKSLKQMKYFFFFKNWPVDFFFFRYWLPDFLIGRIDFLINYRFNDASFPNRRWMSKMCPHFSTQAGGRRNERIAANYITEWWNDIGFAQPKK